MKLHIALILAYVSKVQCARRTVAPLPKSLRSEIGALTNAVAQGDVHSVDRIFLLLSAEAKKRSYGQPAHNVSQGSAKVTVSSKAPASVSAHLNLDALPDQRQAIGTFPPKVTTAPPPVTTSPPKVTTLPPKVQKNLLKSDEKKGACVLDDVIFSMTPEAKVELRQELEDPKMKEAFTWTRSGGWWHCAMYGELCTCHGSARMVSTDYSAETPLVDVIALNNSIKCDVASFNNMDVKPGYSKLCECSHPVANGADTYHLHKRLTSKSYLQEIWIFLLRMLGRANLLPAGTGDRLYHGMQNWAARHHPYNIPMVLERVWVQMYVQEIVKPIKPGPRCLEWGDPNNPGYGFNYAYMIPECTQPIDMQYEPIARHQKTYSMEGNVVYSDVNNLPTVLTATGDWRVNIIFATQVFEHLHNPEHAAKLLFQSLLPGGVIVFTAPQQAQFHKIPGDYFRYTKEGCVYLLQNAGFCVPAWAVAGGGDFIFDIARDAGLQVQDFSNEEIAGAFQKGYHSVSDSAVTIHAMGFVPPHWACDQAMPAIR